MARVLFGQGVATINGSMGGNTFRETWRGHLVSGKQNYRKMEPTKKQLKVRIAFEICNKWIMVWEDLEFVNVWGAYAHQHPKRNKKGIMKYLTWRLQFIRHNMPKALNDEPLDRWPPKD